jgi:hypothetical protein
MSTLRITTGFWAAGAAGGVGMGACLGTAGLGAAAGLAYGFVPILGIRLVGCFRLDLTGLEMGAANLSSPSFEVELVDEGFSAPTSGYGNFEVFPPEEDEEATLWAADAELEAVGRAKEATPKPGRLVLALLTVGACARGS